MADQQNENDLNAIIEWLGTLHAYHPSPTHLEVNLAKFGLKEVQQRLNALEEQIKWFENLFDFSDPEAVIHSAPNNDKTKDAVVVRREHYERQRDYKAIAHHIYCKVGMCGFDPLCFDGADKTVQDLWIEAVKEALHAR